MRRDTMYNLNLAGIGAASGSNLLSVAQGENSCTTPRTPEILNSLIAMSNPFDSYRGGSGLSSNHGPRLASSPPSGSDTNSTCSSGSPSCTSPPSVQLTCSKLIKEGLRHTLQTKRRNNSVSSDAQLSSVEDGGRTCKSEELTPEDEERRRRRRERNKIAATKCRMKKRERTVNLVQESEILETQNHDLKSQIQELEIQRKRLVDMLSGHRPSCKQAVGTASASNFSATEQQTYHHLESAGSCSRSSSTVETMVYQRVNICNHPAAAAVTMESASTSSSSSSSARLSYRRVEVSATDYQRPPPESHTPRDATPYDESTTAVRSPYDTTTSPYSTAVQSPYEPNYQAAYQEELPKDEEVWRSGSGASLNTQFGRVSNSDSGVYSCQQSLSSGMNSPMPFLQSDDGDSPFSRTPSGIFSRPTSLDVVSSDYDSNAEIIDSPTIPPPLNYRHYDTADSAYYVPPNRGGCIS